MPDQPIRDSSLYISWQVRKALNLVVLKIRTDEAPVNADAFADKVLSDWVKANHPDVAEFLDQEQARAKAFRDQISKKP